MSFNNLKKNDVVFSESKGSRVFKLISKKDNHWVVGDMFTKKYDTITESDTFRVVKTENKPKPISLLNLVESNGVSISPTLTEKEVFLIEELKGSYDESSLHEIIESYEDGITSKTFRTYFIKDVKVKYIGLSDYSWSTCKFEKSVLEIEDCVN